MKFDRTKWKRRGLVALGVVVVVAVFVAGRMTAPGGEHEAPATELAADDDRERWYTCSMHPQVRSRDPNEKCPICGMGLIPVPDDGDEDDGDLPRLRVGPRAAALMEIETVPVRRVRVEREIPLYGRVEADERRIKTITAWTSGRIDRLHIDFTGQAVRAGEPMLELYSPPLIAAQEELLQALEAARRLAGAGGAGERTARDGVTASRDKLRLLGVGAPFIDELETTGSVRETIAIPAPLDGVVTARHVSLGEWVETGGPILGVADLSRLWVQLSVFESELAWLRVGQEAEFTTQANPGRTFTGAVAFIDPMLDERTRSVLVRIDVDNQDGALKPGMFARGVVRAGLGADPAANAGHSDEDLAQDGASLVIPASSPLITGRRAVVYVRVQDEEQPTFEGRTVVLGPRAGDFYVVREGLAEGDVVVSHGAFRIDSELQIRGRPSMMAPEGGGAPGHQHDHAGAAPAPRRAADAPTVDFTPVDVPDAFAAQVVGLFDRYVDLSEALAADDLHDAHEAAGAMLVHLRGMDPAPLDTSQREAWVDITDNLREPLDAMASGDDIEIVRTRLVALTEATALALHRFAGERAGPVYRAHCPMAFDFTGADWLQRDDRINNPYFGATMLRCGTAEIEIAGERNAGSGDGR